MRRNDNNKSRTRNDNRSNTSSNSPRRNKPSRTSKSSYSKSKSDDKDFREGDEKRESRGYKGGGKRFKDNQNPERRDNQTSGRKEWSEKRENTDQKGFKGKRTRFDEQKEHDKRFNKTYKPKFKPHKNFDKRPDKRSISKEDDGMVRLNKYIASTGLCSRREADEFIILGLITVNDEVITELGAKIKPDDVVKYDGGTLNAEKKVYVLLNKPKDFVTTVDDPQGRRTVLDLVKNACKERIYPVGRLDRNTTGVLLLTNDGELTKKLTHPKYNYKKIYHVFLDKAVSKADMEKLTIGFDLEDGFIKADEVNYVEDDKKQVGVEIHSGRNRIIRRMFSHLGYKVIKLDRVYFAGLTKKGISRGGWKYLNEQELNMLKRGAY